MDLKLDASGKAQLTVENQWDQLHSPLNLILQASLLETGGRPVTRRATQAIWPAEALPGIRPLFGNKAVYDYRSDSYHDEPTVPEQAWPNSTLSMPTVRAKNWRQRSWMFA